MGGLANYRGDQLVGNRADHEEQNEQRLEAFEEAFGNSLGSPCHTLFSTTDRYRVGASN